MPPTCSFDVEQLGPVFLLSTALDEDTCEIIQPVLVANEVTDQMFKDLRMASFALSVPPTVVRSTTPGVSFYFKFDPDTVVETIPGNIELIVDELALRLRRHKSFQQTGPAVAIHSTKLMHGRG